MDLTHLAAPGTEIAVRVAPKASRNAVVAEGGAIRVYVPVVPEGGRAKAAVVNLVIGLILVAVLTLDKKLNRKGPARVEEMTDQKPALRFENIVKTFPGLRALNGHWTAYPSP